MPESEREPAFGLFAWHKPRGVLVSTVAERGATTVFELLAEPYRQWFAVGRLDKDSSGLLLLCSDSRLAQLLMDPGRVPKTYLVAVQGQPSEQALEPMRRGGIELDGQPCRALHVERIGKAPRGGTRLRVILREGRNRQIRRLFWHAGFRVRTLCRVAFGPITLDGLTPGCGRELVLSEVMALRRLIEDETETKPGNSARQRKPR
jgi:pseudouridine synthase